MRRHRKRVLARPVKPESREPKTDRDWLRLMHKVIARAEKLGDPRVPAFRTAINQGRAAQVLKRLRVICDNDILRVFPDK